MSTQPATIDVSAGSSPKSATGSISRRLVLLLAASTGLTVANLYYAQPLLQTIAHQFHTGSATAGLIVTFTQVGYATAQLFLVPVGDFVPRRVLVPAILALEVVALVLAGLSPNMTVLISVAGLVGLTSAAAQILVPFAAQLASPNERGRVVGIVTSGLLLGILLARTVAGIVADLSSWRVVYLGAAGITLILALVLYRNLPSEGIVRAFGITTCSCPWLTWPGPNRCCAGGRPMGRSGLPPSVFSGRRLPFCCRGRRITTARRSSACSG